MVQLTGIVTIIGIALMCVVAEELYSDQYDYIDAKDILENDKLREQYSKCFMNTEPCRTPDMKFFKKIFFEGIATQCKKCTEKQKQNMDMIVDWYINNKPEEWQAMFTKAIQEKQEN